MPFYTNVTSHASLFLSEGFVLKLIKFASKVRTSRVVLASLICSHCMQILIPLNRTHSLHFYYKWSLFKTEFDELGDTNDRSY